MRVVVLLVKSRVKLKEEKIIEKSVNFFFF
jgi:hypothetical protein